MITSIESRGIFIDECRLEGETRGNGVFPSQHNTLRLSQERWLVVFATRGFRGIDDNRSIVYQIRKGTPDGPVIKEAGIDMTRGDWDAAGDGHLFWKECNTPIPFGVPRGAMVDGTPAPNANFFGLIWYVLPRVLDRHRNYMYAGREKPLPLESLRCHWLQFRLNEAEDDIEILQPVREFRESGFETGKAFCRHQKARAMNISFVPAVPFNADKTEWAQMMHLDGQYCTVALLRWDPSTGLYEWNRTGPQLRGPGSTSILEASLMPYRGDWIIAARPLPSDASGVIWFRVNDPLEEAPQGVLPEDNESHVPRSAYTFPDGVIRLFTTDQELSPYRHIDYARCPLQQFDIDPDSDFRKTASHTVFDSIQEKVPIRLESKPAIHFCRLVPHETGSSGRLTYAVRSRSLLHPYAGGKYKGKITPQEMAASVVYYSVIEYDREYPGMWEFVE